MCHPSWGRALAAAQRLHDLARLRRVRDQIDRDHARPLNIEALARAVGMPAGRLGQEFRLAYGRSPHEYLMARQAERDGAAVSRRRRAGFARQTGQESRSPGHRGETSVMAMAIIESVTLEVADPAAADHFYTTAFGLGTRIRVRAVQAPTTGFRAFTLALTVS